MIHDPFYLLLGSAMAFVAIVSLIEAGSAFKKRQMSGSRGAWASLALGAFWMSDGVYRFSGVFDGPFQTSPRTHFINIVAVGIICVIVVPCSIAAALASYRERKLKKAG